MKMVINKHSFIILLIVLILQFPSFFALSFNFSDFSNTDDLNKSGDAFFFNKLASLTKNQVDSTLNGSGGRVVYSKELHLWDAATGQVADFDTHFSFSISMLQPPDGQPPEGGDGMAFFLAPNGSQVPENSFGGCLGLITNCSKGNATIVAVEFDTYKNDYDQNDNHVAIDINSIWSVASLNWSTSIRNGSKGNAWISYNSQRKNLSLFLSYDENPVFYGQSSLSYEVNLTKVLPEWVTVGFSSATGDQTELHYILSWQFNSTEFLSWQFNSTEFAIPPKGGGGLSVALVVGCSVGGVSILAAGFIAILLLLRRRSRRGIEEGVGIDDSMDQEFEQGMGPKRFSYAELVQATNNFSEEGKLGQGGFGGVYKGFLKDLNSYIAVKRVSRGSKQGIKEYAAEVKIISRLRHRNLVQLLGWCHERMELLLVYEFLPNGSLDSHLFKEGRLLDWEVRYGIAKGLASGLLYLHEEWEQCVVHRDIKSSNIMLDSDFNAKLGDFGLARFVDHGNVAQTTVLAGTMGYMAPECMTTGKASKETDVYSFGIVALEIACGRKTINPKASLGQVYMVQWVWELYGEGKLLEAADTRLSGVFDAKQMERLMIVGLWCAHPDENLRPPIRKAIHVLKFEAALPNLPPKMPVPTYHSPSVSADSLSLTYGFTDTNNGGQNQSSTYSCDTNSSQFAASSVSSSSSASLLHSQYN